MLTLQSNTGRIFSIDLADVESIDYDGKAVLTFHTPTRTVYIGGKDWGGPVDPDSAREIIEMWAEHHQPWPDEDDPTEEYPPLPDDHVDPVTAEEIEEPEPEPEPAPEPKKKPKKKRRTKRLGRTRRKDRSR